MRSFRIPRPWVAPVAECCVLGPSFRFGAVVQLRCGEISLTCRAERAKGSPKTHTPPPPLGYPVSFAHGVTRYGATTRMLAHPSGSASPNLPSEAELLRRMGAPLWGAAVSAARLWLICCSPQPPRWRLSIECRRGRERVLTRRNRFPTTNLPVVVVHQPVLQRRGLMRGACSNILTPGLVILQLISSGWFW